MRRTITGLLAAALLGVVPGQATAADEPQGVLCGFSGIGDSFGGWVGEIDGGPVAVTGDDVASIDLVCTVRPSWADHTGPAYASATASGPGVAAVPPTLVTFWADPEVSPVACTEVRVQHTDGGTTRLYWDDYEGAFSSSPHVPCRYDDSWGCDDRGFDCYVCPVTATALPPDGDITLPVSGTLWDCPPYDT